MENEDTKPIINEKDKRRVEKEIDRLLNRAEKAAKRGEYSEAAFAYQESAKLAKSVNDRRAVDLCIEEAKCNMKLGNDFNTGWAYKCAAVYSLAFNDFSNVVNFATKAIEYFSKTNSIYAVQWCYNLIGQAGEKKGDYDLAAKNYRRSLEIEYSEEIDKKIGNLSKLVPSLLVEQRCEKDIAKEGEKIDVILTIKNGTREPANEIKILGGKSNELESIPTLRSGESKTFKYKLAAFENAKPLFCEITWKDAKGEKKGKIIEPPRICVIPNINVKPYLRNKLEVGKKSLFVISVSNNSKERIEDINIELSFPVEFKVYPVTGYSIDAIGPDEEKGFVFKILPTIVGKTIMKPEISFKDANDRRYVKNVEPFVLEESLGPTNKMQPKTEIEKPVEKSDLERLRHTERFKRYLESFISPKNIDEFAYIKLTKQLHSSTKGYTLTNTEVKTVSRHIMEECRSFALCGEYSSENHALFMFSGESKDGTTYLLTVVVKGEDNLVHVAFRLYSDKEDETDSMVEKISDITEYTVIAMTFATEIQKIEVNETINIIDSIVQRSKIGERTKKKDKSVDIKDSVVQRTEL